jgi:collagenase-like PrtC family protease
MTDQRIELLAPARDLACGMAAINCGADAVYIGAPRFGARANAGNSLPDIETLVGYAHTYWAKVYITLNTLLRDDELPDALRLISQLYDMGVDGLIVQDVGLLECDLPPLPLIASTQMHNATPARVAFLEQVGFQRAILARELDLEQIAAIRRQTGLELECFVHGALCVSYSGQCYLSYALGGRSGNRGECAQPCRRCYSLVDGAGSPLVRDRYLLSLRDLNLSAHLAELLAAGITSFKIEGRLKDEAYVTNVVSFYRRRLDRVLQAGGWARSSSGESRIDFKPDVAKTFNRGYTTYYLHGRAEPPGAPDTPKMVGEAVGLILAVDGAAVELEGDILLRAGDGLCFFDETHTLRGTTLNAVRGRTLVPDKVEGMRKGTLLYRNHDHAFLSRLQKARAERRIPVRLRLEETADGFALLATDADGNAATGVLTAEKVVAEQPGRALAAVEQQLAKMGDTAFVCAGLEVAWSQACFLPFSALNALRRDALEKLAAVRAQNRPVLRRAAVKNSVPYPERQLTFLGNVLNRQAAAFYRRHGVLDIAPAAEAGMDMRGERVMRTRYCIKHQLGLCVRDQDRPPLHEPLYLVDEEGRRYRLRFDCAACEMEVVFEGALTDLGG